VCIVLHIPADSPSLLAHILNREGTLPAKNAENGEAPLPGHVYVAPPDRHMLIGDDGRFHVARGPRENRHRPAVDPLFRSAALQYGNRAVGVILSGTLDDGTAGLLAIKQRGGITVIQDPKEALYPSMPLSAQQHVEIDHCLRLESIPALLTRILEQAPSEEEREIPPNLIMETRMAELDQSALETDDRPGRPSAYSCPDCGGVLWEIQEGEYDRFCCRVGHAYSPETMLGAQEEVLEDALWTAVKTLEESARLSHRLASTERERGHDWLAQRFEEKERDARHRVEVIRKFLLRDDDATVPVQDARRAR
jgi:two-component system chemotaxis response regulator CheB